MTPFCDHNDMELKYGSNFLKEVAGEKDNVLLKVV